MYFVLTQNGYQDREFVVNGPFKTLDKAKKEANEYHNNSEGNYIYTILYQDVEIDGIITTIATSKPVTGLDWNIISEGD